MLIIPGRINLRKISKYQSQVIMCVQAKTISYSVTFNMNIKLISVLYMKIKMKKSKQECAAHDKSIYDDKNCQSTKCGNMQSVRLAVLQSSYKKHSYAECQVRTVSLCDDKNCQSTKSLL